MKNNTQPLVTIITVTFNIIKNGRLKHLRQCLESVHGQTYKNIEHIIIDGASKDGTLDLIQEYSEKGWVKCFSEPDSGIYDAMNKGIKQAMGKYVLFINSDDYLFKKDVVALSVDALEKTGADFSYGNYMVKGWKRHVEYGDINRFIYSMPFGHPTMFTKTDVLRHLGGFDEEVGLPADYDLVIRLIFSGFRSVYVDRVISVYRPGGAENTTDTSEDIVKIYLKNYSSFFKFENLAQGRSIMYKKVIPAGFTESFKEYFRKLAHNNIDLESICGKMIKLETQHGSSTKLFRRKNEK